MMEGNARISERKVIIFRLKDEEYGVDVNQVLSIERMQPITRVPNVPVFVQGVINLRGVVTPVIDLRKRFGLDETEYDDLTRIVIVQMEDKEVGLIVDAANDVIDISVDIVEEPPAALGAVDVEYLEGVAKLDGRLLVLLNLEKVLSKEEVAEVAAIEG